MIRLLVTLMLFPMAACVTASPVVRLKPRSDNITWVQGRGIVVKEAEGVRVAVAYERNIDARVAFQVEVLNESNEPLVLNPPDSFCNYCEREPFSSKTVEKICPARFRVLDPETEALAAEVAQSRSVADHGNTQAFHTGLFLLAAVGDASAHAKGKPANGALLVASRMQRDEDKYNEEQLHIGTELEFWQRGALRRTTLRPGEATSGLMLVNAQPFMPLLYLVVQVGQKRFRFDFDQTTVDPEGPRHVQPSGRPGGF